MEWLKEAIEWIMKYSTQGDDSQAKKKCINPLKGMPLRTNNICRAILKFKSPNEVLREYLTRVA